MPKISKIGPGTEVGKQILSDFKNWKITGFKPTRNVGSSAHYRSRSAYQVVTASAFRSQAQKIAKIALEQMSEAELVDAKTHQEPNPDDESLPNDSENKNPWSWKFDNNEDDGDDEEDEDFSEEDENSSVSDNLDTYEEIEIGELENSRSPFLLTYPCGKKLLVVFPLDGDVNDQTANQFEFVNGDTEIKRWSRIPKERESAISLVGTGTEKSGQFCFHDIDLFLVNEEIQKRLESDQSKRDDDGFLWEQRGSLTLPFRCTPTLYSKSGKVLKSFQMRSNGHGFAWAYFWLLAQPLQPQLMRIGGKFVSEPDDESVFTYKSLK